MDIYRAKWVLPVTAEPVEDGAIAVEDGRIVHVGPADAVLKASQGPDAGVSVAPQHCGTARPPAATKVWHGRPARGPTGETPVPQVSSRDAKIPIVGSTGAWSSTGVRLVAKHRPDAGGTGVTPARRQCHEGTGTAPSRLETSSKEPMLHDLGDRIVLPGFVNAHTHLELTCYRGRVAAGPLWEWFEQLMELIYVSDGPKPGCEAVAAGVSESLASGVTCVGDISRTGIQIEALRASPIRKVCFLELISGASLPPNDLETLASMLDRAAAFSEADRLIVGISPHTLYTVTQEDLVGVGVLASERKAPLTIHVLETMEEAQWLADGSGHLQTLLCRYGLPTASMRVEGRATERLQRAGLMDHGPLLVHVNYIEDEELKVLAASRASVAWCPRSHRFFGHAPHRWREMLAAGVNVCVGTDSLASNDTLSILDELRHVRRIASDFEPGTIVEMGTIRGAIGLGLDRHVGSLEVGKSADFVALGWSPTAGDDPVTNILDGSENISGVWVGGTEVTRRG